MTASGSGPGVVEIASADAIRIVRVTLAVWAGLPESWTCNITVFPVVLTFVGVPLITPAGLRVNPKGSTPDAIAHV